MLAILALNAGSATLKFSLLDAEPHRTWAHGSIDLSHQPAPHMGRADPSTAASDIAGESGFEAAVARIVVDMRGVAESEPTATIEGVLHRVVHGGSRFTEPVLIPREVRAALAELVGLAPLHKRPGLQVMDAALEALPGVVHVAVFDTSFHSTLTPEASTYPMLFALNERWGLRRYGFHGLSHAYAPRGPGRSSAGPPNACDL